MFQPFSRSLATRNCRSENSLNSERVASSHALLRDLGGRDASLRRQVLRLDRIRVGHDQDPLDQVAQLPDVARPGPRLEDGEGARRRTGAACGDRARRRARVKCSTRSGMSFGSLAQGRRRERDDVQTEVEVLAEAPLPDPGRQVPVGRREDAHGHLPHARRAHGLDLARLEHPQHLGLRARRHVADLVQEDRSAVGLDELPDLPAHRAGEGALLVAEELRLDQLLGNRRAVDLDERARGDAGGAVDLARHELLARAALALDQDRRAGRRGPAMSSRRRRIGALVADEDRVLLEPPAQPLVLGGERSAGEGVLERDQDPLALRRLLEKVHGAAARASTAVAMSPCPEIMSTGGAPSRSTMRSSTSRPSIAGHLDVEQDGVRRVRVELGQGGLPVGRRRDVVAFVLEDHPQRVADARRRRRRSRCVWPCACPPIPEFSESQAARPAFQFWAGPEVRRQKEAPAGAGASVPAGPGAQSILTRAKKETFPCGRKT